MSKEIEKQIDELLGEQELVRTWEPSMPPWANRAIRSLDCAIKDVTKASSLIQQQTGVVDEGLQRVSIELQKIVVDLTARKY